MVVRSGKEYQYDEGMGHGKCVKFPRLESKKKRTNQLPTAVSDQRPDAVKPSIGSGRYCAVSHTVPQRCTAVPYTSRYVPPNFD
ncbi:hypothetical protein TWF102_006454 [Orbilia oligospora]|uniref:Uncharacterized protein n=1 Tax=Orbilia oligospora TaxID=2813651 RepID=A0A7C8JEM7_ORBOL|nr:hypothetical protein TWF102_006454 [Orbilia oligospora]